MPGVRSGNPYAHREDRHLPAAVRPAETTSTWTQPNTPGPKLAKSACQPGSCQSLSTDSSATRMNNNAQRLRDTTQCVDLHAHQLLCINLQLLCCLSHLPAQFALISTCYNTPSYHLVRKKMVSDVIAAWRCPLPTERINPAPWNSIPHTKFARTCDACHTVANSCRIHLRHFYG